MRIPNTLKLGFFLAILVFGLAQEWVTGYLALPFSVAEFLEPFVRDLAAMGR